MKKEKDEYNQMRSDIKTVLGNESGRRFLFDILDFCKIDHSVVLNYTNINNDVTAGMLVNAGKQEVGHHIINLINEADPFLWPNIQLAKAKKDHNDRVEEEKENERREQQGY